MGRRQSKAIGAQGVEATVVVDAWLASEKNSAVFLTRRAAAFASKLCSYEPGSGGREPGKPTLLPGQ